MAQAWEKGRCVGGVAGICLAKFGQYLPLLSARQPDVHDDQNGKHDQRKQRRPLEQKAEHDEDEAAVLWVSYIGIRPRSGEFALTLGLVKDLPGGGQQDEPAEDQPVAEEMQGVD